MEKQKEIEIDNDRVRVCCGQYVSKNNKPYYACKLYVKLEKSEIVQYVSFDVATIAKISGLPLVEFVAETNLGD